MGTFTEKFLGNSPADHKLVDYRELVVNLTEDLMSEMDRQGVSQAGLARRLGKSRAFVSQMLSGDRNMTLRSLVSIAYELGLKPSIRLSERNPAPTTVTYINGGGSPVSSVRSESDSQSYQQVVRSGS